MRSLFTCLMTCFMALILFVTSAQPALAAGMTREPAVIEYVVANGGTPTGLAKYLPMGRWMGSVVIPGLGQVLLGEFERGINFFVGTAIATVVLGVIGLLVPIIVAIVSPQPGSAPIALLSLVTTPVGAATGALGVWVWSMADAYCIDAAQHGLGATLPASPEPADAELDQPESSLAVSAPNQIR